MHDVSNGAALRPVSYSKVSKIDAAFSRAARWIFQSLAHLLSHLRPTLAACKAAPLPSSSTPPAGGAVGLPAWPAAALLRSVNAPSAPGSAAAQSRAVAGGSGCQGSTTMPTQRCCLTVTPWRFPPLGDSASVQSAATSSPRAAAVAARPSTGALDARESGAIAAARPSVCAAKQLSRPGLIVIRHAVTPQD